MAHTGTRAGTPNAPAAPTATIPFPAIPTTSPCKQHPDWYTHEESSSIQARQNIADARLGCAACPAAKACLLWALANPDLATVGIWASTTPYQRTVLRNRLVNRLGRNWVTVVQLKEKEKAEQRAANRVDPPSVHHQVLNDLHVRATGRPLPSPRRPVSAELAQAHREVLTQALRPQGAAA